MWHHCKEQGLDEEGRTQLLWPAVCVCVCVLITAVIALHLSQAAANTEAKHGTTAMFTTHSLYLACLILTPLSHTHTHSIFFPMWFSKASILHEGVCWARKAALVLITWVTVCVFVGVRFRFRRWSSFYFNGYQQYRLIYMEMWLKHFLYFCFHPKGLI